MNSRFIDKNIIGSHPLDTVHTSRYIYVSPLANEDVSFNWLNVDFPYWHNHDHWEFYVVTHGSFIHSINGESYSVNSGDACLVRPNDTHKLSCAQRDKNSHHIAFLFTDSYAQKIFSAFDTKKTDEIKNGKQPLHFHTNNFPLSKIIDTTLSISGTGISIEEKTFKTKLIIDALFSEFFLQYYVKTSAFPQWLSDFLLILNDPKLKATTVELASHTPYSYSRLSRIFKEYMETTIVDYIKNVKYRHACNLLTNTDMSILEISNELYYDSISYFNKTFKSFANMTPTEFRNKSKR